MLPDHYVLTLIWNVTCHDPLCQDVLSDIKNEIDNIKSTPYKQCIIILRPTTWTSNDFLEKIPVIINRGWTFSTRYIHSYFRDVLNEHYPCWSFDTNNSSGVSVGQWFYPK